jgi:hypothetical protein
MKAYVEVAVEVHSFLALLLDRNKLSASLSGRFTLD